MRLLVFAASNSRQSINKQLITHAAYELKANNLPQAELVFLDLNDFEMPIYSIDRENADGIPHAARRFRETVADCDGILASFAEHNGSYTVAYKNIFDWASRLPDKVYQDKTFLVLSTSPGARGAASVLKTVVDSLPHFGARVAASLSIGSFGEAFNSSEGRLTRSDDIAALDEALAAFASALAPSTD